MIILRNKEFARRDYAGLNQAEADALRAKRADYAKGLRKVYRESIAQIDKSPSDPLGYINRGAINGGGVTKSYKVDTTRGLLDSDEITRKNHKNGIRNQLSNNRDVNEIMRNDVLKDSSINHSGPKTNKYATKTTPNATPTPIKKGGFKLGTKGKIGLGVATAVATGAGATYLYNKKKAKK